MLVLLPLAACAAIFGFDDLQGVSTIPDDDVFTPPPDDAGTDTSAEASDPCTQLGIPTLPTTDASGDNGTPVYIAFKTFDTGGAVVGLNLDRTCSPTLATGSCTVPNEGESDYETYARDFPGTNGLDNSSYRLLNKSLAAVPAFTGDAINQRLHDGEFGYLLRISRWNGLPNDDDVLVEVFPALGIADDPDSSSPQPTGTPHFDANDVWVRDNRFQQMGALGLAAYASSIAFVQEGRLIARFPMVVLPITIPHDSKPFDITIREGYLAGDLTNDGPDNYKITNGIVAGRWSTFDLLNQIRLINFNDEEAGVNNVVLCTPGTGFGYYALFKGPACQGRDIRAAQMDDNKGLPCDALSAGMSFETYGVNAAGPFYDASVPERCTQDGDVPDGDSCQ